MTSYNEQPDVDSRDVAGPQLSQTGFPDPVPTEEHEGIGTPWLGLPADPYHPAGGKDADHPHVFHLQNATGNFMDGGSLQGANSENWPILTNQKGAVYLARLKVGGIREPHWHPSAWEMNFVISGRVRWSLVGPGGTGDAFEGKAGDLVFAPQGHFHYFENASDSEDLVVLIVFNTSVAEPDDDIGLVESLSAIPPDVLGAIFGVPADTFTAIPKNRDRVVIASKNKEPANG